MSEISADDFHKLNAEVAHLRVDQKNIKDQIESAIEQKYQTALALLEQEAEKTRSIRMLFAGVMTMATVVGAALVWFGLETYDTTVSRLERQLSQKIDGSVGKPFEKIDTLAAKFERLEPKFGDLAAKFARYEELFSSSNGEILDVVHRYAEFDKSIDDKRQVSRLWRDQGAQGEVDISQTFYDPIFRHGAAQIFGRLIESARSTDLDARADVSASILFNAAANAAIIDMDGYARLLADEAVKVTAEPSAHVLLRQVRMTFKASDKPNSELIESAQIALRQTTRMDSYLAFSEIWNIATDVGDLMHFVDILREEVPEAARTASFHMHLARMLQYDGRAEHRSAILNELSQAVDKLEHEFSGLPNHRDARGDLSRVLIADSTLFLDLSKEKAVSSYRWIDNEFFRRHFDTQTRIDKLFEKLEPWMMQAIYEPLSNED